MLNAVIEAVKTVAQAEIMPRYLKVARQRKSDGSMFTEADIASQNALTAALVKIADHPVLGEEMPFELQKELWQAGEAGLWCIDPIDGTSNFVNGLPYFAVSVALMRQGRSVLGVVYDPVADEMFYAEAGKGAFLNGIQLPIKEYIPDLCHCMAGVDFKRISAQAGAAACQRAALQLAAQFRRQHAGLVLYRGGALRCLSAWRAEVVGLCRRFADSGRGGRGR